MAFINWDDGLSTGIKSIDNDHKSFFMLLNRLYEVVQAKQDEKQFMDAFYELEQHFKSHFRRENKLLKKYQPDNYIEHLNQHQHMIAELEMIKREFDNPITQENTEEILKFLRDWIIEHIIESDMPLSLHVKRNEKFQSSFFSYSGLVKKVAELMSLPKRIVLTAAIPIAVIISFAIYQININVAEVERTESIQNMVGIISLSEEVIHHLQAERGLSMGLIYSDYSKFQNLVTQLQDRTDVAFDKLKLNASNLITGDAVNVPDIHYARLMSLKGSLDLIKEQRTKLIRRTADADKLRQLYTHIITTLLSLSDHLVHADTTNSLHNEVNSKISLLHYKEKVGVERALGLWGIQKGESSGGRDIYTQTLGAKMGHLETFFRTASDEQVSLWQGYINQEEVQVARDLGDQLQHYWQTNQLHLMREDDWWQAQTARQNALHALNRQLDTAFSAHLNTHLNNLKYNIHFAIGLLLLSLSALGFASLLLTSSISYQINRVTKSLTQLSRGRFDSLLVVGKHNDAFQRISLAYEQCRMQQLKAKFQNEQLALTNKQVKRYKAISSTDFLTGVIITAGNLMSLFTLSIIVPTGIADPCVY